jgi:hypothetical protein
MTNPTDTMAEAFDARQMISELEAVGYIRFGDGTIKTIVVDT